MSYLSIYLEVLNGKISCFNNNLNNSKHALVHLLFSRPTVWYDTLDDKYNEDFKEDGNNNNKIQGCLEAELAIFFLYLNWEFFQIIMLKIFRSLHIVRIENQKKKHTLWYVHCTYMYCIHM